MFAGAKKKKEKNIRKNGQKLFEMNFGKRERREGIQRNPLPDITLVSLAPL